jgi:hypothetical protein
MAFDGPRIWRELALRRISAGEPVGSLTDSFPTKPTNTGRFSNFCFHGDAGHVSFISRDGRLVFANARLHSRSKIYFDTMTQADESELRWEYAEYKMRTVLEKRENLSDESYPPSSCPDGHTNLVAVGIEYGTFDAPASRQENGLPVWIYGGSVKKYGGPTQTVGCSTCGRYLLVDRSNGKPLGWIESD